MIQTLHDVVLCERDPFRATQIRQPVSREQTLAAHNKLFPIRLDHLEKPPRITGQIDMLLSPPLGTDHAHVHRAKT